MLRTTVQDLLIADQAEVAHVLCQGVWGQAAQKKEAADRRDTGLRKSSAMLQDLRAAAVAVLEA